MMDVRSESRVVARYYNKTLNLLVWFLLILNNRMKDEKRKRSRLKEEYATESESIKAFFLLGKENSVISETSRNYERRARETISKLLYWIMWF